MKSLVGQLSNYALYHRDRRNIATHFVGIPMIVVGIEALLARPFVSFEGIAISPALVATVGALGFYLLLDRWYGLLMAAFLGGALFAGNAIAGQSLIPWLVVSIGLFGVGWAFQVVGHLYEGKKPAFIDDLVGLLVGPLFIVVEASFFFGAREGLRQQIEHVAGPTRGGREAQRQTP
jgi:uncharacterized membrane protein YGL010W